MQLEQLFFVYGVACHALFLGVYAWMAAFVGNLSRPDPDDRRAARRMRWARRSRSTCC